MFLRRKAQVSPTMTLEGALGPNDRLEEAEAIRVPAPAAMCVAGGALLVASGTNVLRFASWGAVPEVWHVADAPVTAIAAHAGKVALGLGDRFVVLDEARQTVPWAVPKVSQISDLCFADDNTLVVADPGYMPDQPLLTLAAWDEVPRGQLLALTAGGEARQIADGLHCPMGMASDGAGLLVSELERARIIDTTGRTRLTGLPAYLGRLRRTSRGYALACLSRRDPLIEFLKTEPEFIRLMKATVDPSHWIAPREKPDFAHDLPITLGATRLHGAIKPWAPSFSYGLVIEMDENLMPIGSAQSRANGKRHAIADICDWNGSLLALSRASGEILKLGAA